MSKRNGKKSRIGLKGSDTGALCMIAAAVLYVIARATVVSRTGIAGAAYIFSAYQILLTFLLLFPLPLSETLADLIPARIAQGRYKNGKHLFNAGVVQAIFYAVIVVIAWLVLSERISLKYLLGRYNTFSMLFLIIVFVFDLAMLTVRGYLNPLYEREFGFLLMIRQGVGLVMVIFLADFFKKTGTQVSALLKNNEVGYAYSAAGVALGLVITAFSGAFLYISVYIRSHHMIRKGIQADGYKYGENSFGIVLSSAFPLCITGAAISAAGLLLMGRYFSLMHENGGMSLISYQWGLYTGICRSSMLFPMALALFIMMSSFREVRQAVLQQEYAEVRFKLQGLFRMGLMIAVLFSALFLSCAGVIVKGFFGVSSLLAVRLLRMTALLLPPAVYAIMSSLAIHAEKRTLRVALHIVFALGVAMLLWRVCLPVFGITIYGVLFAEFIFTVILSAANFIHLRISVGLFISRFDALLGIVIGFGAALGVGFLLSFLLGLFLPAILVALITAAVCFLIVFWSCCFFGSMQKHILKNLPLGQPLRRLARKLGAMR